MHDRLIGELAAAREAEDERRREKEIRAALLGVNATNSSPHPDLDFLSRALEVSLEQAGFLRTILFAVAIEAGEALFLLLGTAPMDHGQGRGRSRRIAMHLLSACRRGLERAKCKLSTRAENSSPPSREASLGPEPQYAPVRPPPETKKIVRVQGQTCSSCRRDVEFPRPFDAEVTAVTLEEAVAAFIAECSRRPEARVPGNAMLAAYDRLRLIHGWRIMFPAPKRDEGSHRLACAIAASLNPIADLPPLS